MIRYVILVSGLLCYTSWLWAREGGDAYESRLFTTSKGTDLPYRILFPENFDPDQKYPLILFLHGAGERGADNELQLTHGAALFLDESNRREYPAIVVFPQCPDGQWWVDVALIGGIRYGQLMPGTNFAAAASMLMVMELMEELLKQTYVDRHRVYALGLSMGAFGVYDLLQRRPQWFAAAVAICGGGDIQVVPAYASHTALWIFHGVQDPVIPVESSRMLKYALMRAGAYPRYTEYSGVYHNSWDPAFAEPDLLPWLFGQHH